MILFFLNVEFLASFFTLLFHLHQEALYFLFAFHHKGVVICISEVIDTSPCNLDFSLCFIQPRISHDVFCLYQASLTAQSVKNLPAMQENLL